jgi:50S ribosomal protein L16 3-hydroxylase
VVRRPAEFPAPFRPDEQRGAVVATAPAGEFWRDIARHYGREPFETDDPPPDLAVTSTELFRLLVRAAVTRGAEPTAPQIRFHVGQRQVIADLGDYLPVEADGSLDGYLARLEHQLGGEPWLLAVERGHVPSRQIWKQAASFLAGLYGATGAMPASVDVEVFVGRYPHTIPGIHRERSGVFVSMVQGAKDILVWPPESTGLPLGSARYAHATARARRLRCAPGRLVYWPAMHWHVGESPEVSAGLHIAVLDEALTVRDLLAEVSELDAAVASRVSPGWAQGDPDDLGLPAELDAAVQSVVGAYANRDVVRDRLIAGWLRRRTALGFPAVPPPRRITLGHKHVLTRDGVHPIVLASRDAATSWLAADGRVGYARSVPGLVLLVDRLNSGQSISVAAAIDLATAPFEREVLMRVLTLLASWRALATSAAPREAAAAGAAPREAAAAGEAGEAAASGAAGAAASDRPALLE